ncbi:MAG: DNA topoisomerase I [bacterium]|nr:DNA topoisomerase I [bacterium]
MSKTTLIIAEKPSAALKIAEALADKSPKKNVYLKKIPYYELTHKGENIIVACAVGHLYTVTEKNKKGWTYPVFDIEWKASYEVNKGAAFTKPYLQLIQKLCKESQDIVVACDYDVEGEVIGFNIVRFACGKKDAFRMKFSTTTKEDLRNSYDTVAKHLDHGQAEAGITRHELDWLFGINLSRALTLSIKNATGMFKILSSGRVQGPALKLLSAREKDIQTFIPVPYWELELDTQELIALHEKGKFDERKKAEDIYTKCNGKKAVVTKLDKEQFKQDAPHPFDLTALQLEAYRVFRIQPKETLEIAQVLYINSYISYPRTSSNQLPESIGYKKVLQKLSEQQMYTAFAQELLKQKELKPNNGKKKDEAHPAIYPTGEVPGSLEVKEAKVYDLIVKRFLATFAQAAVRETVSATIDVNKENFLAKGTRTVEENWHKYYRPYVKLEEAEVHVKEKQELHVKELKLLDKETSPPRRYTPASIIKELEKKSLGTKCLLGNTPILINDGNGYKEIFIESLFNGYFINYDDSELIFNQNKFCLSKSGDNIINSNFLLVSRRMLNDHEKIYKVTFADGSFVEATGNHPILISNNCSEDYIPISNLSVGQNSVATYPFFDRIGSEILSWESFVHSNPSQVYGFYPNLRERRGELSQVNFSKDFNATQCFIQKNEKKVFIPIRIWSKLDIPRPKFISDKNSFIINNPFPLKLSSNLCRIMAKLIGDGSIDRQKIIRENCFDFRYHNTNLDLIDQFIDDVHSVFGVKLVYKKGFSNKYYVRVPALIGRILFFVAPEVLEKNVSKLVTPEFYPEFIGGLFDDEGCVHDDEPKLFISNTNIDLLYKLKSMLLVLGISSSVEEKAFKLFVRRRRNLQLFLSYIPIKSVKKKIRLIKIFSRHYKYSSSVSHCILEKRILFYLAKEPKTKKEISNFLDINFNILNTCLNNLRKQGFLKKVVIGISERPRKLIKYFSQINLEKSFYSFIDEKVISPSLITKKIISIEELNLKDCYVYDLTNSDECPNFILGNGVVVHNSTRSEIVESLFERNYLKRGDSIEVTNLGLKTVDVLQKYCPDILDEQLTRDFEKDMNKIRKGKSSEKEVLAHAKVFLGKVLGQFKAKEKEIGKELSGSYQETMKQASFVQPCVCGGDLQIRYTPKFKSYFIACSKYPECKITFSLPRGFLAKNSDAKCNVCSFPEVLLISKGKRPWNFCINPNCPKKDEYKLSIASKPQISSVSEDQKPSVEDQPYTSMP